MSMPGMLLNNPALGGGRPQIVTDDFGADSGQWLDGNLTPAALTIASGRGIWAPTLGDELLTDPGMEAWTSPTNLTSWSEGVAGSSSVNQEASVIHGGSNATRLDIDASNSLVHVYQPIAPGLKAWCDASAWVRASVASRTILFALGAVELLPDSIGVAYARLHHTVLSAASPVNYFWRRSGSSNSYSVYVDDCSCKVITLATLYRVRRIFRPSYVEAAIWNTLSTQKGVVLFKDVNNFIKAYLDGLGNVLLVKRVAGTYSATLGSGAVAYTAGHLLRLIPDADFDAFSVNYNGTEAIAAVAITDFAGMAGTWYAGLFSTYDSGNINVDAFDSFAAVDVTLPPFP